MKQKVGMEEITWNSLSKTYQEIIRNPEGKVVSVSHLRDMTGCSKDYIDDVLIDAGFTKGFMFPHPFIKNSLMQVFPAEKVLPLLPHPTEDGGNSASQFFSVPELAEKCMATENAVYCFIKKNGIKFSKFKKPFVGKKKMLKTIGNDDATRIVEHFKQKPENTKQDKQEKPKTYKDDPEYAEFLEFKKWMKIQHDGRENFDLQPDVKPEWVK